MISGLIAGPRQDGPKLYNIIMDLTIGLVLLESLQEVEKPLFV